MRKRVPREYAELFCVGELTEMEKRLYGGDPYRERVGGMHYCTKTEKAGDTLVLTVYPILGRSDRAKAEAARKAMSRERQNRHNRERARRRLALLMDANFGRNDLHVTLTYRGTPPDYEQARKDVRNYLRAVKRMREKAGLPEMKYIYVIEEEGGDGEKRRIHVHLMMTGGVSREALEEKWGRGYANCDRLAAGGRDGAARAGAIFHQAGAGEAPAGLEANLIQQWIGSGEAMYPVDENVRLTEQGAAALMEMEGKDAEAVAWRSVGDGSELAEALKGIPARIDGAALAWKVCLKVEIQSGTVRVKELEDGSMAYVWEALLEPCKRKGKLLRMTRVDGKQGVYAVYAEDDLAGVVSGISKEEREEMLRTLREIC